VIDDDLPEDSGRGQAVLEREQIRAVMLTARKRSPQTFAMLAWLYEFGARAAEIGLQRLRSVNLKSKLARPIHLKGGQAKVWHTLLPFCREALPLWIAERPAHITVPEHEAYLFPGTPGRCYTCKGTGKRPVLKREGKRRFIDGIVDCHHCGTTGKRWGISRIEVHRTVVDVLTEAGVEAHHRHPHVLRHSIVTHLLDGGAPPKMIQDRVGHASLNTTMGYVNMTRKAQEELEAGLADIYKGWT